MPQKIRMWEVSPENTLSEIASSEINLEERLEDWLASDISMLDPNLMVIGRQVRTDFDKYIDLLCIDRNGNLVVVELKKGKSPRDVTAQALDYASWARHLSAERIGELSQFHLKDSLAAAFTERFGVEELPKTLNENHRSLIVAEAMDASTERIVQYLSDLNVPINVVTVQHFGTPDGREVLAQVYLVDPEVAATKADSTRNRRTYSLISEIQEVANENGVGDLYNYLKNKVSGTFATFANSRNLGFRPPHGSGNYRTLFDVNPTESSSEKGLKFRLNGIRAVNHFGISMSQIEEVLPENCEGLPPEGWQNAPPEELDNWVAFQGYFRTRDEIDRFLDLLKQ